MRARTRHKQADRARVARRRERRQARRRSALLARNPAERHWYRRRRGVSNSAPELRHRSSEGVDADLLIGGRLYEGDLVLTSRPREDEDVSVRMRRLTKLFKGVHPLSDVQRNAIMSGRVLG